MMYKLILILFAILLIAPVSAATCQNWEMAGLPTWGNIREWRSGGFSAIGDTLYMCGGDIVGPAWVWKSTDGIAWEIVNASYDMPMTNRLYYMFTAYNNSLWFFGGVISPGIWKGDVWKSTDEGNTWTLTNASAVTGRTWSGFTGFNGKLWIFGGTYGGGWTMLNDSWWSVDGVIWTQANASAEFTARMLPNHNVVVVNDTMWIIGGNTGPNTPRNDTWYTHDGEVWYLGSRSAGYTLREAFATEYYDNKFWVAGDYRGDKGIYSSNDGITYSFVTNNPDNMYAGFPRLVNFNNSLFYYLGGGNQAAGGYIFKCCPDSGCPTEPVTPTPCITPSTQEVATNVQSDIQGMIMLGFFAALGVALLLVVIKMIGGQE